MAPVRCSTWHAWATWAAGAAAVRCSLFTLDPHWRQTQLLAVAWLAPAAAHAETVPRAPAIDYRVAQWLNRLGGTALHVAAADGQPWLRDAVVSSLQAALQAL